MDTIAQVEKDLDALFNLQEVLKPLDKDRQEVVLESYASDLQVYTLRYGDEEDKTLALEGIGDMIKAGIDMVINLIKKIYNWIMSWFGGGQNKIPVTSDQINEKADSHVALYEEAVADARKATEKAQAEESNKKAPPTPKDKKEEESGVRIEDTFKFGSLDFSKQGKTASTVKTLKTLKKLKSKIEANLKSIEKGYDALIIGRAKSALSKVKSNGNGDILATGKELARGLSPDSSDTIKLRHDIVLPNNKLTIKDNTLVYDKVKGKGPRYFKDITTQQERDFTTLMFDKNAHKAFLSKSSESIRMVETVMKDITDIMNKIKKDPDAGVKAIPAEFNTSVKHCLAMLRILKTNADITDRLLTTYNKMGPVIYTRGLVK